MQSVTQDGENNHALSGTGMWAIMSMAMRHAITNARPLERDRGLAELTHGSSARTQS